MISHLGTRWSIVVPYLAFGVTQVLLGAVPVTAVVAVVGFVLGGSITLWNVVTVSIRQRLIEPAQFGRVNSVYRWIGTGAGAFGALVGGQLAYTTNLRVPYLAAGAITLAALGAVRRAAPTRHARHRPGRSRTRSHAGAAVDDIGLAGDPARQVGGEEHRQVGDVLRLAESLQRERLGEVVTEVLDEVRREVGLHQAGRDPDDPGGADLTRQLAGQVDQRRLRHVVDAESELGAQPADRGDVDDDARLGRRTPDGGPPGTRRPDRAG